MKLLLSLTSCFAMLSCATGGRTSVVKPEVEIFILDRNGVATSDRSVRYITTLSGYACMSPSDIGSLLIYIRSLRENR